MTNPSIAEQPIPERLLAIAYGFMPARTLLAALELDIFTVLDEGPLEFEDLRSRIGIHSRGARDFFDALVALELVERTSSGYYVNTLDASLYLVPKRDSFIFGALERSFGVWLKLTEGLVTGRQQAECNFGDFYRVTYRNSASAASYLRATTNLNLPVSQSVAASLDWSEFSHIVDLGSAEGSLLVEIALRHKSIRGTGVDSPVIRSFFEDYVYRHRQQSRLRFVGADFLTDPLPPADAYVLGHVLHILGLEERILLLARCYEMLPRHGLCSVYERLIDNERRTAVGGLLSSLNLLIDSHQGSEFTAHELTTWMRATNFHDIRVIPLARSESLVVGRKE